MRLPGFFNISAKRFLFACSLSLMALLAACGGSSTTTGSTPTAAPTSQPSPTAVVSPTSGTALTTYTGNGYTIGYPQGWKANVSGKNVVFSDSSGIYSLTIVVAPDPAGAIGPDTVVNTAIEAVKNTVKNPQTVNVPSTTSIGGDSWVQKSITGTSSAAGQTGTIQIVVASDNHPANSPSTNSFTITYETLQATFDAANTQYFQPMLQSFKFTA